MEFITIKQCREIILSGQTFSFKCVTYDKKRKKGGDIMEYSQAVMIKRPDPMKTEKELGRKLSKEEAVKVKKAQNHFDNYTFNLRILQNGRETSMIKKIHPPLLIEFNGLTVVP